VHNRHVHTRRRDAALVIVACAVLAAYAVITRPATPITAPDTQAYLEGSPLVPVGYPLLLETIGVEGTALLQPIVFSTALAALGIEVAALTGNVLLAAGVLAAIVLIPDLMMYHASILTESLFISGLVAFMATTTRFARSLSWQGVLTAALIAAATASIRRTALAFVPVVFLMVLVMWRRSPRRVWPAVAAALVPMIAFIVADRAIVAIRHGDEATSLTGRHLFAKAALIDAPSSSGVEADPVHARLAQALDEMSPVRALINGAPSGIRASLVLYYETCLQWPCVAELRAGIPLSEAARNEIFADVALARIRAAPWQFVQLTATHYGSLWTAYKLRHPETAAALADYLASHRPLPFEREVFKVEPGDTITFVPSPHVAWLQPLVIAVGVLTGAIAVVGGIRALVKRVSPLLFAAVCAAATAHLCLLFTAIAAAGISRFMIAVFPAIVVAILLASWALVQKALVPSGGARYH
jgi:hypothetical protein